MIEIKQPTSPQLRISSILGGLSYKCRMFSLEQVHHTWWNRTYTKEAVRTALQELERKDLIVRHRVLAYPMLDLMAPVISWRPGEEDPDYHAISNVLQSRWTNAQVRPFTVYIASRKTLRTTGGKGGSLPPLGQETHDLHVSEIFCAMFSRNIRAANSWVGEELLKASRKGEKLPDALLINSNGDPYFVIEFGGAYNVERVGSFHEDCAARQLPYQLW